MRSRRWARTPSGTAPASLGILAPPRRRRAPRASGAAARSARRPRAAMAAACRAPRSRRAGALPRMARVRSPTRAERPGEGPRRTAASPRPRLWSSAAIAPASSVAAARTGADTVSRPTRNIRAARAAEAAPRPRGPRRRARLSTFGSFGPDRVQCPATTGSRCSARRARRGRPAGASERQRHGGRRPAD